MSHQLQISSLFSTLALVCLCLFVRVSGDGETRIASGDSQIVQVLSRSG